MYGETLDSEYFFYHLYEQIFLFYFYQIGDRNISSLTPPPFWSQMVVPLPLEKMSKNFEFSST